MDITLQVVIAPKKNDLTGIKDASRYVKGDILDVHLASRFAELQPDGNYKMQSQMGSPVFAWVHVTGVPDSFTFQKIKSKLTGSIEILDGMVRKRQWHIPPSEVPTAVRQELIANREYTGTFYQAKAIIRKKTTPVILDSALDDISTSLADGDLS